VTRRCVTDWLRRGLAQLCRADRVYDVEPPAQGDGRQGRGLTAAAFHVIDQVDVVAGAWLVLAFVVPPTLALVVASLVFVFVSHQAITVLGFALGMRPTWR